MSEALLKTANLNAAKDYDMAVSDVERIRKYYPNNFYEKLEEFISSRARIDLTKQL